MGKMEEGKMEEGERTRVSVRKGALLSAKECVRVCEREGEEGKGRAWWWRRVMAHARTWRSRMMASIATAILTKRAPSR